MQTTHLQQPSTSQPKRAAHQTQHVGTARKSNAECEVYVTVFFWQGRGDNEQCKINHD